MNYMSNKTYADDTVQHTLGVFEQYVDTHGPLTKREYFAAMAMQGLMVISKTMNDEDITHAAVFFADSLIEELNKGRL